MSLLGRFLGGSRKNAYSEGVSLLEAERYAEAADHLRTAYRGKDDSPSGSLVSFHFRQALVAAGRVRFRAGRPDQAGAYFAEAVELWGRYPDLRCLLGAARGFAGNWDSALAESREALRQNPDYAEARLLESVALQELGRAAEAAHSLNALVEAGRRVDHWLIGSYRRKRNYTAKNLPADMKSVLEQTLAGRSEKEEVAAAVAQCRAGNWEEGLVCFAALVEKRPRYPDYRTRHAAALFQLARNEEALAEVEAALALNEDYRTAIDLKALILADAGRIATARTFLQEADERLGTPGEESAPQELFGSYLRGVLALLAGDVEAVAPLLGTWPDLIRNFARAELLLAAADDLQGHSATCGRRLAGLTEEWTAEAEYFYLLACHHLAAGRYQEVAGVLGRWPGGEARDLRPLYLEGCAAVLQGRQPPAGPEQPPPNGRIPPPAWDFLRARALFLAGEDAACWRICRDLEEAGFGGQRLVRLATLAACGTHDEIPADWSPPRVVPDSCLPGAARLHLRREDAPAVGALLREHLGAHPEILSGYWLSADFWLAPIRNWIG